MYYEINVAKKVKNSGVGERYEHYFATAPRSLYDSTEALQMLKHFQVLFPSPEYSISISKNPEQFTCYSAEEFLKASEKSKSGRPKSRGNFTER